MKNSRTTKELVDFWLLLAQAYGTMRKVRRKELAQYNISAGRAALLDAIQYLGGKAGLTAISQWMLRERHSVREILCRMEKDGLVKRINDPNRKNGVIVTLTRKGIETHQTSAKRDTLNKIMSSLSEESLENLKSSLRILLNKAKEELGPEE